MKTLVAVLATLAASTANADHDRLGAIGEGASRSNAGDHGAAIKLFEQAYLWEPDAALLPIMATEYRRAGLPLDAIDLFCQYLKTAPAGSQVPYATTQILAIRIELGQGVQNDVCAEPTPTQVDFVTPHQAPAKPGMSKREMAGIVTGAAGVLAVVAGLHYNSEARSISNSLSNHSPAEPWPDDIQALERRGQRAEDRAQVLLLGGGAALVTAGILYFTGRADRLASEKLVVAPTVSPDGGGISFARGF